MDDDEEQNMAQYWPPENHFASQIDDAKMHHGIVQEHVQGFDRMLVMGRLHNKIDGYFSGAQEYQEKKKIAPRGGPMN